MLVYLLLLYILLIVWISGQCEGCDTGWFGGKCQFMCHCSSSQTCDIEGQCPNNEPCKQGFFGPGCQYVDVVQLATPDGAAQYLRDADDTTCNPQTDATNVAVSLTEAVPISWFRVGLKDKTNMFNFTTTLNDVENCTNERKYLISDTLVDVGCDRGPMITSLKISGPAAGSICSLYISGGRNVALRQTARQSSWHEQYPFNKSRAENAVDGHSSVDFQKEHCASTNYDPPNWWTLTFSLPQILYKVVIYNRIYLLHRLTDFYFETFDEDNTTIAVNNYSYGKTGLAKYEVTISTKIPVLSFTITHIPGDLMDFERLLTLCEVQAFGDPVCPADIYGLDCDKQCQCNVTEACNPVSGVCSFGCLPGFYGFNCSSRCGEHCLPDICEFNSGNCLQCTTGYYGLKCSSRCGEHCFGGTCDFQSGDCFQCTPGYLEAKCDKSCDPGRFGSTCSLNCSTRCTDVCNNTNGYCLCEAEFIGPLCTECAATLFGSNCEHNCSDLCENRLCNKLTGKCLACVGSRVGFFCQDCPWKHFGPLCGSKCNPHCLNWTCNQVSGRCLGCEEGYEGNNCLKIQDETPWWLILIPLLTTLCLLALCWKRRAKEEEESMKSEKQMGIDN